MEEQFNYSAEGIKGVSATSEDSPIKQVESVVRKLLANVSGINHVDEDWGQLDYYSQQAPVKWPCALFDVSDADFTDLPRNRSLKPHIRQNANCMLSLTVANLKLGNSSHLTPVNQKTAVNNIKDLIQLIHEALQGVSPIDMATPLLRRKMQKQRRDDGIQEYTLIYSFGLNNV